MATRLCHSSAKQLADEALDFGKKLLELPSSTAEIINILTEVEKILFSVQQSPSRLVIKALDQIVTALIAKELLIHPDVDVNILVACCICDVLTIMTPYNHEQMKEFFQLVVVTFEKLTSARGGCYTKMMKVLETLSSVQFMELMSECLHLDGLIVRLFKQFISVADSNSSAVVSKMEQIMTMILGESKDLDELAGLLTTSVKKDGQITSPVSCQLGKKVLNNCAARLSKSRRPDMRLRRCQNSESEKTCGKYMLSSHDPPTPSKVVNELNGKRKRDDKKVQSVEHGENLVGEVIKVWWPVDKKYYKGVVESFDCSEKKHTVLYADGDVEHLDLKEQQWELVRKVSSKKGVCAQALAIKDLSAQAPARMSIRASPKMVRSTQVQPEKVPSPLALPIKDLFTQILPNELELPIKFLFPQALARKGSSTKALPKRVSSSQTPPKKGSSTQAPPEKVPSTQVQSFEHGENLVGETIKVWWPLDKWYYEGVVESFDCSEKKHTVLYADGDVEHLDLKEQQWELVRKVSSKKGVCAQALAIKDLSAQAPALISTRASPKMVGSTQVQSFEHGENLVGETIKVWWPLDKWYYGVVESFDCREKKHTVLYDDGDVESLDLKEQRWELVRKLVVELPVIVSSPQSGVTCVQGYTVKNINAPVLESIFKKHGDIAATCLFKPSSARESILDVVCDVVRKIQTNDVTAIVSEIEELLNQVSGAEAVKMNVAWLRAHLEAIHKWTEAKKKCSLLMKMIANTSLVRIAAEMDLKESLSELTTVQERFENAKRGVEVLNLVEKSEKDSVGRTSDVIDH